MEAEFDKTDNGIYDYSFDRLRNSFDERNGNSELHREIVTGLFKNELFSETRKLSEIWSKFYNFGFGSLDLALGSSLLSQQVFLALLTEFDKENKFETVKSKIVDGRVIVAVANAEESGTNLLNMKSYIKEEAGELVFELFKPCHTNGNADFVMLSAKVLGDLKDSIGVFILPKEVLTQENLTKKFFAFESGSMGSTKAKVSNFNINKHSLGSVGSGVPIIRHTFNLERWIIAALACGVLEGATRLIINELANKKTTQGELLNEPWVQDKFIESYKTIELFKAVRAQILQKTKNSASYDSLNLVRPELALINTMCSQDSFQNIYLLFQAMGNRSASKSSHIQRLLRDFSLLNFIGGTHESQKMQMWNEIKTSYLK